MIDRFIHHRFIIALHQAIIIQSATPFQQQLKLLSMKRMCLYVKSSKTQKVLRCGKRMRQDLTKQYQDFKNNRSNPD